MIKVSEIQAGDKLRVVHSTICMQPGQVKTVLLHAGGYLYVPCAEGGHTLDTDADLGMEGDTPEGFSSTFERV